VLDASVVTDALVRQGNDAAPARLLLAGELRLHVPSVLAAEVTSALRKHVARGRISAPDALSAVNRVSRLRARRYAFEPFADRVWQLRDNVTVYDAWYVALAEMLGVELVTTDDRLRRANGPRCPVLTPEEALTAG
jgi:predicted nucleic acid-binding protein